MDTSGFYKKSDEGEMLYAPNFVYSPVCTLLRKEKDTYKYPADGWTWYESEVDARVDLNIPFTELENTINQTEKKIADAEKEGVYISKDILDLKEKTLEIAYAIDKLKIQLTDMQTEFDKEIVAAGEKAIK